MLPSVHIRKEAFLVMMWAAKETFKSECLGFLWGHPPSIRFNWFLVSDAIPLQSVRRRANTEVEQSKRGEIRLRQLKEAISSSAIKLLGYFHSHNEWGKVKPFTEMSKTDLGDMRRSKDDLEIVVAVTSRKKGFIPWALLPDGSIKGSFLKLVFHFNAYTLDQEQEPQRLQIVAPTAIKFLNRLQKRQ